MKKHEAMYEAKQYFNKYAKRKYEMTGVAMKVRVVELTHDCMGNKNEQPVFAWHDASDDVFAKNSWKDEPTVMTIEYSPVNF